MDLDVLNAVAEKWSMLLFFGLTLYRVLTKMTWTMETMASQMLEMTIQMTKISETLSNITRDLDDIRSKTSRWK